MEDLKIKNLIKIQKDKEKIKNFYEKYGIEIQLDKPTTSYFSPSMQKNNFIAIDKLNSGKNFSQGYQTILSIPFRNIVAIIPFSLLPEKDTKRNKKLSFLNEIKKIFDTKGISEKSLGQAIETFQLKFLQAINKYDLFEPGKWSMFNTIAHLKENQTDEISDFRQAHKSLAIDILTKYLNEKIFEVINTIQNEEYDKFKVSTFTKLDDYIKFVNKTLESIGDENIMEYKDKNKYLLHLVINPGKNEVSIKNIIVKKSEKDEESNLYLTKNALNIFLDKKIPMEGFVNTEFYKNKKLTISMNNKKEFIEEIKKLKDLDILNDKVYKEMIKDCK